MSNKQRQKISAEVHKIVIRLALNEQKSSKEIATSCNLSTRTVQRILSNHKKGVQYEDSSTKNKRPGSEKLPRQL